MLQCLSETCCKQSILREYEQPFSHRLTICFYCIADKYRTFYNWPAPELMVYNKNLWPRCKEKEQRVWCLQPDFINNFCSVFPFHIMKTVRVPLNVTQDLLGDPNFPDLRIILLIRDPRGTIASRHHRDWCPRSADCFDPGRLCMDMTEDYMVFQDLKKKYPGKVM